MGISAEAYQEWSYVLERNGSSIDVLKTGMKTLEKQVAEGSESFDTLGVSLTNADGSMRSTEDVMNDTLLALAGMEDGAERTALATELFGGKVAQDLNPMLNSGADGIEALKQRAEDLNIVMSDQGVADSAAFSDAMTDLNLTIDGLKNTIGVALLPVLTTIINVITSGIAIVSQAVSAVISFVGTILGAVGKLAAGVGQGIGQVVQWFGQLPSKISSTLSGLPNLLINAGKSVIDGFKRGLEQAWNGVTG
jgi:hypothetical protein